MSGKKNIMVKDLSSVTLVTIVLFGPRNLEAQWNKPLETLLDKSCTSFFVFPIEAFYYKVRRNGYFLKCFPKSSCCTVVSGPVVAL